MLPFYDIMIFIDDYESVEVAMGREMMITVPIGAHFDVGAQGRAPCMKWSVEHSSCVCELTDSAVGDKSTSQSWQTAQERKPPSVKRLSDYGRARAPSSADWVVFPTTGASFPAR